ncbi:IclR family transcriptional regulator [Arthrobacter sp. FW305-BF8]|nr:IclR family transcriptional regulator [Arthrobacter sp. FW305-BF8]
MSLLELVLTSTPQGLSLAQLASMIGAPKSSVHGLAKGLVATGYFREDKGRYVVGPAVSTLLAAGPSALPAVYHHALEELTQTWGETSMLATLVGDSVVYIDTVESPSIIRASPTLNERLPLWPRSSGKCFLAAMSPERLETYLRRNKTLPVGREQILDELSKVRETNTGFNIGESIADHISIASPIVNGTAPATLAIALVGPKSRMEENMDQIAKSVRQTAASLSSPAHG